MFCLVHCPATLGATLEEQLAKMTVEEKVGQTMIWTFPGTEFNNQTEVLLKRYHLGALIAFSRNIKSNKQIAKFNSAAQNFANKRMKAPLFLMVDQEGGPVTRVKAGAPQPSALALGRFDDPSFVESYAKTSGEWLRLLGFNMNLAPVLDLSNPAEDTFIGNRAFGGDPSKVSEIGLAYATGLSAAGLIPTAKHFPGHGGMSGDSHRQSTSKAGTIEELEKQDWLPFIEFSKAPFPKAIMMAHVALPTVDSSGVPGTYSAVLIQEILRNKFAFDGLIITDDLEMNGASVSPDIGERAVRAFLAGNDMLMLAGTLKNQKHAFKSLLHAVQSERISRERLDASVRRILELKRQPKFAKFIFDEKKNREMRSKIRKLSKEVMQKNFKSSVESSSFTSPAFGSSHEVLVLAADKRFYESFKENYSGKTKYLRLAPGQLGYALSELTQRQYPLIVYYASGSKTAKWANGLPTELKAKIVVVNCNHPGKINSSSGFLNVLHIHSFSPESGGWLAMHLSHLAEPRRPAEIDMSKPVEEQEAE